MTWKTYDETPTYETGYAYEDEVPEGTECGACGIQEPDLLQRYQGTDREPDWCCDFCIRAWEEDLYEADAEQFAKDNCRITGLLEKYDFRDHFAPSPDKYAMGFREAHTENSVRAENRHNATNYDQLLRQLPHRDASDTKGRVYYSAIRARITELLDDAEDGT